MKEFLNYLVQIPNVFFFTPFVLILFSIQTGNVVAPNGISRSNTKGKAGKGRYLCLTVASGLLKS